MIEEYYTITTSHGTMTPENLKAYNEKHKEKQPEVKEPEKPNQVKRCPYINGIHKTCLNKCAFYDEEGKQCYYQRKAAQVKTEGKVCPYSFGRGREACSSFCAMYKEGCCLLLSD